MLSCEPLVQDFQIIIKMCLDILVFLLMEIIGIKFVQYMSNRCFCDIHIINCLKKKYKNS